MSRGRSEELDDGLRRRRSSFGCFGFLPLDLPNKGIVIKQEVESLRVVASGTVCQWLNERLIALFAVETICTFLS